MTEVPLTYCVLLERRTPVPALAAALAKVRSQPLADASGQARSGFGIVGSRLAEVEARALADGLAGASIPALALPESLLEELPASVTLSRCEPREGGLFWKPKGPEEARLSPWKGLALVGAAAFKETTARVLKEDASSMGRRMLGLGLTLATGLPPSMTGGSKKEVERRVEQTELVLYADFLFAEDGPAAPARRLRVDAQDFDFSGLGARMAFDAASNLKRLVALCLEARPQTPRAEGAAILAEGRPLREMPYRDLRDLDKEERWLWTLRALKKL